MFSGIAVVFYSRVLRKSKKPLFLLCLSWLTLATIAHAQPQETETTVLVLFSDSAEKPLYAKYLRFFSESVQPRVDNVVYTFLNSQQNRPKNTYPLNDRDSLTDTQKTEFALVITIGPEALQYVLRNQPLFETTPVMFLDIHSKELAEYAVNSGRATGQFLQSSLPQTLALAQQFQPEDGELHLIYNHKNLTINQHQQMLSQLDTGIKAGKTLRFLDTSTHHYHDFSLMLQRLAENDLVIVTDTELRFREKKHTSIGELTEAFSQSQAAIFTTAAVAMSDTIAGGVVDDTDQLEKHALNTILRLLDEDSLDKLPPLWESPKQNWINYHALQTFNAKVSQLNDDVIVYGKPALFAKNNRHVVFKATALVAAVIAAFVYLLAQIRLRSAAEKQLSNEKQRLQSLLDNIPDAVYYMNESAELTGGNRALFEAFGESGLQSNATIPQAGQNIFFNGDNAFVLANGEKRRSEGWATYQDGTAHYLDIIKAPFRSDNGEVKGLIAIARDSTRQYQKEQDLKQLARIFQYAAESMLMTDNQGIITEANRSFYRATGWSQAEIKCKTLFDLLPPHEHSILARAVESLSERDTWQGELEFCLKNGQSIYTGFVISKVDNSDPMSQSFVCGFIDISELKRTQNELKRLAHYDSLTGLPNRTLLNSRLQWLIEESERRQHSFAVLFLDIDNFKHINDSLGHQFGDQILQTFAKRINKQLRQGDVASRLGGDEFVLLLSPIHTVHQIEMIARRFLSSLSEPIDIDAHVLKLQCSIGVSQYPQHGETVSELIKHADSAMYEAKNKGKNTFSLYNAALTQRVRERLRLEQEIDLASTRRQFQLYYQPVVSLHTGAPIKAEALIRWPLANGKFLPPDKFIPVAEETGSIIPIGRWVIEEACKTIVEWKSQGLNIQSIAVNVSKVQLMRDDIFSVIKTTLHETGCKPNWLGIEVTESTIMQMQQDALYQLEQIKALGVDILIDDFGTGHSSLSMLKKLPITHLKVDRSFIKETPSDSHDVEITRLIVNLGHMLEVTLVAEGIESIDQQNMLSSMGCHLGQGYLFSPALHKDNFSNYCQRLYAADSPKVVGK